MKQMHFNTNIRNMRIPVSWGSFNYVWMNVYGCTYRIHDICNSFNHLNSWWSYRTLILLSHNQLQGACECYYYATQFQIVSFGNNVERTMARQEHFYKNFNITHSFGIFPKYRTYLNCLPLNATSNIKVEIFTS